MKIGFGGDIAPRFTERTVLGLPKNEAITVSSDNPELFIGRQALENENILKLK